MKLDLGDGFEVEIGHSTALDSPQGSSSLEVGGKTVPADNEMVIIGRSPEDYGDGAQILLYVVDSGGVQEIETDAANVSVSRFDTVVVSSGNTVEIFNIGKNDNTVKTGGEMEF